LEEHLLIDYFLPVFYCDTFTCSICILRCCLSKTLWSTVLSRHCFTVAM